MYNGIGLQTPRGSGTNGYIQTSKFFLKPRPSTARPDAAISESKPEGAIRKPNKEILEHDRKRQVQLKLLILQETLTDQGYTEAEIAKKLAEAEKTLEAEFAAAASKDGGSGDGRRDRPPLPNKSRFADTQSHQIAMRKEKQMETLRAALGIKEQQEQKVLDEEDLEPGEFIDDKSLLEKKDIISHEQKDRNQDRKSVNKMDKQMGEAKNESRKSTIDKSKHKKRYHAKGKYDDDSHSESSKSTDEQKTKHRRSKPQKSMDAIKRWEKEKQNHNVETDYSDSDSDSSGNFGQKQISKHKKKLKGHAAESDSEDKSHKIKSVRGRTGAHRHDSEDSDEEHHLNPKKHKIDRERANNHASAIGNIKKDDLSNKRHEIKSKRHDSDSEDDSDIKKSSRLEKEKFVKSSRRDNISKFDFDGEKAQPVDRKMAITRRHDSDDTNSKIDYASTIQKRHSNSKKYFEDVSDSDIKEKNEIRKFATDRHDKSGKLSEKEIKNVSRKRQHHDSGNESFEADRDLVRRPSAARYANRKKRHNDTDESSESDSSLKGAGKRVTTRKVLKRNQSSTSEDSESQISESSSDSYSSDSSDDSMEISHKRKSYKNYDANLEKKNAMHQNSGVGKQELQHRRDMKDDSAKSQHGSGRFEPKHESKDFDEYDRQDKRRKRKGDFAADDDTMPRNMYSVEDEREKESERRLYRNFEDKKRKVDSNVKNIDSKDAKENAIELGHRRYSEKECLDDIKRRKHNDSQQYFQDQDQHHHKEHSSLKYPNSEGSSRRHTEGPRWHRHTEDSNRDHHIEDYSRRHYMEDFGQRGRIEDGKHGHTENSSRHGPVEESSQDHHTEYSGWRRHAEDVDRHHHNENIGSRHHSEHRDQHHHNEERRQRR